MSENGNGTDRLKLIERIKKLIALMDSPNPHESELAAEMAAKLMKKYQFSEADLRIQVADKFGMVKESVYALGGTGKFYEWEGVLLSGLGKVFGTHPVRFSAGKRYILKKDGQTIFDQNTYLVFGYPKDVDMTLFFFKFLRRTVAKKGSEVTGVRERNSYTMGMVTKLYGRLDEMYKKVEASLDQEVKDLVLVKNRRVADFISDDIGATRKSSSRANYDYKFYNQGLKDGERINLNAPISGREQQRLGR